MRLILYFMWFALINGNTIQIENIKQENTFELHRIREIFFRLDKSNILENINLKTNNDPIEINRNEVQNTIGIVIKTINNIAKQLVHKIYLYFEKALHTYNGIAFAYLRIYYDTLIKNKNRLVTAIDVVLFRNINPNGIIHRDSLFTLLNAANKEVKPIFDHFLVYALRSPNYGKSKKNLDQLLANINRHTSQNNKLSRDINNFEDDSRTVTNELSIYEKKLKKSLDVFSDSYGAYLQKHTFRSQSFTKINALKMFMYNELKCKVEIRSSTYDKSELKIIENWNCEPNLKARNFGFMSSKKKEWILEPFSFMKYANSKNRSLKMNRIFRTISISSLVNMIEIGQTEKRKYPLKINFFDERLTEDDEYHKENFIMSLNELEIWTISNFNTNNLLTLKYITMELMIQIIGLISSRLKFGAQYILYKYCRKQMIIRDPNQSIKNIRFLRTYLIIFHSLLKKLKSINNHFTIINANNIYLKRIEDKLSKIVDLLSLDKYEGKDNYAKIQTMKMALYNQYGDITDEGSGINEWKIKQDYILSPTILLSQAIDLLFTILFENRKT